MRKALLLPLAAAAIAVLIPVSTSAMSISFSYQPPPLEIVQPQSQEPVVNVVPPVAAIPVLDDAAMTYIMKSTPPDELIRYYFRNESPKVIERMLFLACREGGMGKDHTRNLPPDKICLPQNRVPAVPFDPSCGADNLTSSASGLFQYLDDWKNWGGYDWSLIVSRDCLEDVKMTYDVWKANGFDPWTR